MSLTMGLFFFSDGYGKAISNKPNEPTNLVHLRRLQEHQQFENPFTITLYEPTYLLPAIYSIKQNRSDAMNNPIKNEIRNLEVNFKLSFKVPIITHIFHKDNALYLAYTQLSYWQAYRKGPFFRETNYRPEILLSSNLNFSLGRDWKFQLFNLGFMHESNGSGGLTEKSWNRAYTEGVLAKQNWLISLKPWYIINDQALRLCNHDIRRYLGNGRLLVAYNYNKNVIAAEIQNLEHGFKLTTAKLSWSFPITDKIKGYMQIFHGYGNSLLDYNFRKNSIGIGLALNDWI
jgi:phospholipase A1